MGTSKAEIFDRGRELATSTFLAQNIGQRSAAVKKRVVVIAGNSGPRLNLLRCGTLKPAPAAEES
jgi:hypothetical protein